jgi:putative addiction module killer protein
MPATRRRSGGISELRIHYGPGYRIYFHRQRNTVVILLWRRGQGQPAERYQNGETTAG